jgi:transcriptional regulator GlxA family with amidase domain
MGTLGKEPGPRRVVLLAVPPVQGMDLFGVGDVFGTANDIRGSRGPAYEVEVVTSGRGLRVPTEGMAEIVAHRTYRQVTGPVDTLLVPGGVGARLLRDPALSAWLREQASRVRRLGSICTGAFLLAEAGLLDGRRATTHWRRLEDFRTRFPKVRVEGDPIWVQDGNIYTSAGVTAGLDLAVSMVEEDLGNAVALEVARELVMFLRRPGGQSQFSSSLAAQATERHVFRELQVWILEHLAEDLSVDALARRVAMSPRNFARVFTGELGVTPARYVENLRREAARRLLERSEEGLEGIAAQCGFGSGEVLRRSFLKGLKVTPGDYRQRFRTLCP